MASSTSAAVSEVWNARRCCFRRKYAKHPSLATIPENSILKHSSHHHNFHRPNIYDRLRICLLILFPVYIITTTLLIRAAHSFDKRLSGQDHRTIATAIPSSHVSNEENHNRERRVVYLDRNYDFYIDQMRGMTERFTIDSQSQGFNVSASYYRMNNDETNDQSKDDAYEENCVPIANWQAMTFSTCNSLHEMNLFSTTSYLERRSSVSNSNVRIRKTKLKHRNIHNTYSVKHLGSGWFRDAYNAHDEVTNSSVAVKTLRLDRDFVPEYYELHRRDSVAMERLTESPYVMDIYGFCGQSVVTELAFLNSGFNDLYRIATGMMNNFSPYILRTKLQIAAMTAMALAHVHSVPAHDDHTDYDNKRKMPASIVHYDINPRNVIISPSGRPKLNDFNVAEFLSWNSVTNSSCGFKGRFREPWWRSPEEMQSVSTDNDKHHIRLDEKVDVYSLGNTLFVLLTGIEPRGKKQKKKRMSQVSQEVASGLKPSFPAAYNNSDDPAVVAIRDAIMLCWEPEPGRRPSAESIAAQLYNVLGNLNMISNE